MTVSARPLLAAYLLGISSFPTYRRQEAEQHHMRLPAYAVNETTKFGGKTKHSSSLEEIGRRIDPSAGLISTAIRSNGKAAFVAAPAAS